MDWEAVRLTIALAAATTAVLTVGGLPLASWLASTRCWGRSVIEGLVMLPLILPPTVVGFYFLLAMGPASPLGRGYQHLTGSTLPFSFPGILLASILCNLPFALRSFTAALQAVPVDLREASWCLGESRWSTFWRITVPMAWPGILTGMVLSFAHTVGEFGVVLLVGGNIPGVTRTLSIAIYDDVQALDYAAAGRTALVLVLFAGCALTLVQLLARERTTR